MDLDRVKTFVLSKLRTELNSLLTYHNVNHTELVFNATQQLCRLENINAEETILILTAALFHDSGFLIERENHEQHSCELAKKYLLNFNYSATQIDFICNVILATQTNYQPLNLFEQIIKDADLFYLGTNQYEEISALLFSELKNLSLINNNENDWLQLQINFLKQHLYYTSSANKLQKEGKQKVLNALILKQVV